MINKKEFPHLTFDIGKNISFPCTLKDIVRMAEGFNFTSTVLEYEIDTYMTRNNQEKSVFTPIVVHNTK